MSTNEKKSGLEGLVEGLGIDLDKLNDVTNNLKDGIDLSKISETVSDIPNKVDLDKLGDTIKGTVGNVEDTVKGILDQTDIDEKLLEKGAELLEAGKDLINKK